MKYWLRTGFLVFFDIILINVSLVFAYLLRFDSNIEVIKQEFGRDFLFIAVIAVVIKLVCFISFRLYSSLWKYAGTHELLSIIKAALLSNAIMEGFIFFGGIKLPAGFETLNVFLSHSHAPKSIFIIVFFIDVFLITGLRFVYRIIRRVIKGEVLIRCKNAKRILVIGGGDAGAIIIRELKQNHGLKGLPVAIIDDNPIKLGKKINGVPIVGAREKILETAKNKLIDEIIIAIPSANRKLVSDIYKECMETGCKVKTLPSVAELINETVMIKQIRDVDIEDLLGRNTICLDKTEFSSFLKNKVVMVTGGGGSIGSELCRQIAFYNPRQLIIIDNYENNIYDIQNELLVTYPDLNQVVLIANIREKQRIESIFAKYAPNVVFHAAAHKHVPLMESNPTEAIMNNVFGTMNVAECACKFNAKKFILISTDKAVNPTSIMGATKRIAEMIIQCLSGKNKTEYVAVRFGNVLGSNGSVIPLFKKQIEQGGPVTVTHPDIIRYFMTISEAVQLVLKSGSMAKGGEIFVLDMGQPVKIYDLAENLIKLSGFQPGIDIRIEFTGLRPGEKLYEELLTAKEGLKNTKNNKIFVTKPVFNDFTALCEKIEYLKEAIMTNPEKAIEYVKEIVPEYNRG